MGKIMIDINQIINTEQFKVLNKEKIVTCEYESRIISDEIDLVKLRLGKNLQYSLRTRKSISDPRKRVKVVKIREKYLVFDFRVKNIAKFIIAGGIGAFDYLFPPAINILNNLISMFFDTRIHMFYDLKDEPMYFYLYLISIGLNNLKICDKKDIEKIFKNDFKNYIKQHYSSIKIEYNFKNTFDILSNKKLIIRKNDFYKVKTKMIITNCNLLFK